MKHLLLIQLALRTLVILYVHSRHLARKDTTTFNVYDRAILDLCHAVV